MREAPPGYIANFDSASAMLRATARFLKGRDFPALGLGRAMKPPQRQLNKLPRKLREVGYSAAAANEAIRPFSIRRVSDDRLARWATGLYPQRRYPAAVIGSSSGALVHLCAALGIPWLPQTFFLPVRQPDVHPDDPRDGLDAGVKPGRKLLQRNPELQLHHMHDPNQDRLPLHLITYFRVKWRRLPDAYKAFLQRALPRGSTIFLSECQRLWPVTEVDDRHLYQFGALGGATPDEFFGGGERVRDYLEHYDSHKREWDPPAPTALRPEAEWGFEPAIRDSVYELAEEMGWKVRRIVFSEPEHLSPLVADLYREWYARRRIRTNRLVVETFLQLEPWWMLRTGSVPFWTKFQMQPSLEWVHQYLDRAEPYDDIRAILMNHGVECVGLPSAQDWQRLLGRAREHGAFLGMQPDEFPFDLEHFARYHDAFQAEISSRYPMPGYLTLDHLEDFLDRHGDRYAVTFTDDPAPASDDWRAGVTLPQLRRLEPAL
jgi:hypothetical protein